MISGQVIGCEIDQNGNLKVATEYTLTDGSKQIGYTRYNCFNFTVENIQEDIKAQCENLMQKIYNLKQNQTLVNTNLSAVKYDCVNAQIQISPTETITIDDK